jgi:hypothetical protein
MTRYLVKKCKHCGIEHNAASKTLCPSCYLAKDRAYNAMGRRIVSDIERAILAPRAEPFRKTVIRKMGHCCSQCGWGGNIQPHIAISILRLRRIPDTQLPDTPVSCMSWPDLMQSISAGYRILCPSCILAQKEYERDERADYFVDILASRKPLDGIRLKKKLLAIKKKRRKPAKKTGATQVNPSLGVELGVVQVNQSQDQAPPQDTTQVHPQNEQPVVHREDDDLWNLFSLIDQ